MRCIVNHLGYTWHHSYDSIMSTHSNNYRNIIVLDLGLFTRNSRKQWEILFLWLSICMSVWQSVCLFVSLSVCQTISQSCQFISLSIHPSVNLSVCQFVCHSIYLPVHLSVKCQSFCQTIGLLVLISSSLSVCLAVHSPISRSFCQSVYQSIFCLSISIHIWLSTHLQWQFYIFHVVCFQKWDERCWHRSLWSISIRRFSCKLTWQMAGIFSISLWWTLLRGQDTWPSSSFCTWKINTTSK